MTRAPLLAAMAALVATAAIAAALLAAGPARAEEAGSPFSRLAASPEASERILACGELAKPPHRGNRAYLALVEAMKRDLSERVRLAAAVAVVSYPGGQTLTDIDAFLKTEPGAAVRVELLVALSTETLHFGNPDATRIIASALSDDPSSDVRFKAATLLGARGDVLALGAVGRAAGKDENKGVREAARRAMITLSKPPKPKPKAKLPDAPKLTAKFGVDPCPRPWGWCKCEGAITLKPKCLTQDECRNLKAEMSRHSLLCKWDGLTED